MTCGLARTSAGAPSAMTSPWSSTVIRSLMPMTTRMSCSMSRTVSPSSARSLRMKSVISRVSLVFMPAVGSSSRSSFGPRRRGRARSRAGAGRRRAGCVPTYSDRSSRSTSLSRLHRLVDRVLLLAEHRGRAQDRIPPVAAQVDVDADPDVVERRHRPEQPDVLERPPDAQRRHLVWLERLRTLPPGLSR